MRGGWACGGKVTNLVYRIDSWGVWLRGLMVKKVIVILTGLQVAYKLLLHFTSLDFTFHFTQQPFAIIIFFFVFIISFNTNIPYKTCA